MDHAGGARPTLRRSRVSCSFSVCGNIQVDTLDSVQLASLGLASFLTGGLLPRPMDEDLQPDRRRCVCCRGHGPSTGPSAADVVWTLTGRDDGLWWCFRLEAVWNAVVQLAEDRSKVRRKEGQRQAGRQL